jgi:hypothetical protein
VNSIKLVGLAACVGLFFASFAPWTYHADLHKFFTGIYSENNAYGKPGIFLSGFAAISGVCILLQKIWAKRFHLFLSALFLGYAVKTYILYTSCYNAYCPEKKYGIYLMLLCTIIILIASIFPKINLKQSVE